MHQRQSRREPIPLRRCRKDHPNIRDRRQVRPGSTLPNLHPTRLKINRTSRNQLLTRRPTERSSHMLLRRIVRRRRIRELCPHRRPPLVSVPTLHVHQRQCGEPTSVPVNVQHPQRQLPFHSLPSGLLPRRSSLVRNPPTDHVRNRHSGPLTLHHRSSPELSWRQPLCNRPGRYSVLPPLPLSLQPTVSSTPRLKRNPRRESPVSTRKPVARVVAPPLRRLPPLDLSPIPTIIPCHVSALRSPPNGHPNCWALVGYVLGVLGNCWATVPFIAAPCRAPV